MARKPEPVLTYEDYLHFPDEQRWELLNGEAYMSPAPGTRHQLILGRLHLIVGNHVEAHGGGLAMIVPWDIVLSDIDVVQPDLVYVSDARMGIVGEANVRGTPDWVLEVLSDPRRDRDLKRQIYARRGIDEYWIVDPDDATVDVHLLSEDRYPDPQRFTTPGTVSPGPLPDLAVDLAHLCRP